MWDLCEVWAAQLVGEEVSWEEDCQETSHFFFLFKNFYWGMGKCHNKNGNAVFYLYRYEMKLRKVPRYLC